MKFHFCFVILAFLALSGVGHSAKVFSSCAETLSNLMESNITVPVLEFETLPGFDEDGDPSTPLIPVTKLNINLQAAIRDHVQNRNSSNSYIVPNNTNVIYFTVPYPWCTHKIEMECISDTYYGIDRDDQLLCPLKSRDIGVMTERSPYEAGRITLMFDLLDPACNSTGTASITYYGVSADRIEPTFTDVYTFPYSYMPSGNSQSGISAITDMVKEASCSISDGIEPILNQASDEIICGPSNDLLLRCPAGGHPMDDYYGPDVVPTVLCIDNRPGFEINPDPSGPQGEGNVIIRVEPRYTSPILIDGEILFDNLTYVNSPQLETFFVVAGLTRQIYTPYQSLAATVGYRLDNDPYVRNSLGLLDNADLDTVPSCICDVTVDCNIIAGGTF